MDGPSSALAFVVDVALDFVPRSDPGLNIFVPGKFHVMPLPDGLDPLKRNIQDAGDIGLAKALELEGRFGGRRFKIGGDI